MKVSEYIFYKTYEIEPIDIKIRKPIWGYLNKLYKVEEHEILIKFYNNQKIRESLILEIENKKIDFKDIKVFSATIFNEDLIDLSAFNDNDELIFYITRLHK